MGVERLATLADALPALLDGLPDDQLSAIARKAAATAFAHAASGLALLGTDVANLGGDWETVPLKRLLDLSRDLDIEAATAEERTFGEAAAVAEAAFRLARAIDAMVAARGTNAREAASTSLYESFFAVGQDPKLFEELGIPGWIGSIT